MIRFPDKPDGKNIAVILPQHLVGNMNFLKMEVLSKYMKDIPDFKDRVTFFGSFTGIDGRKPTKKQSTPYIEELFEFFDTYGYENVLCMDANYFKLITGEGFEASVGRALKPLNESFNYLNVTPIVSPLVIKQRPAKLPLYNRSLKASIDMIKGQLEEFKEFKFDIYENITDPKDARACLKEILKYDKIAWDIETTGLHHRTSELITHGIAVSVTEAYTFVVHEKFIGKEAAAEMHEVFREFFMTYKGQNIIHNVGFESKFMLHNFVMKDYKDYRAMNAFLKDWNFEDTMLMNYALLNSTERVSLGLKDLVKEKYGDYDSDVNVKDAINQDIDKLAYYNGIDVSATYWLYEKTLKELAPSQLEFYNSEMKDAQKSLTALMVTGIMVDMPNVLEAEQILKDRLAELDRNFYQNFYVRSATENIIDDMVVKYNESHKVKQVDADFYSDIQFNVNSTIQLRSLLFETMEFTPIDVTKTGAPKTDRATLEELLENETEEDKIEVLEALIGFSEVSIILNTFIRALRDDSIEVAPDTYRLYPNYRVGGTLSFRPTSNNINLLNDITNNLNNLQTDENKQMISLKVA